MRDELIMLKETLYRNIYRDIQDYINRLRSKIKSNRRMHKNKIKLIQNQCELLNRDYMNIRCEMEIIRL